MARKKYALCLSYNGYRYIGWQRQGSKATVQKAVEDALEELHKRYVPARAASRTDSGVHAEYQIATFQSDRAFEAKRLKSELNALLPSDIRVRKILEVHPNFEARGSTFGKHYRYLICEGDDLSPFLSERAWAVGERLDDALMQRASQDFLGIHDFDSFRTTDCESKTTEREIYAISVSRICNAYAYPFKDESSDLIAIDVIGSAFLKHMIRFMTAALVQIGAKRAPEDSIRRLLSRPERGKIRKEAPSTGLCLLKIFLSENERQKAVEALNADKTAERVL